MDFDWLPSGVERGVLAAGFAGAMAYLCTQDKMPLVRAISYAVAGTAVAVYIGPGIVEYLAQKGWASGEKTRYAVIFITGVSGIWLLNIIVSILGEVKKRVGDLVQGFLDKFAGGKQGGGQ